MKGKSKAGGGKLPIKKPSSARDKPNLRKNIGRNQPQPIPKKDIVKKDSKKIKTIENEKSKNIPIKKENSSNIKKEEKEDKEQLDKEKELLSSLQKDNKDFIKVFVRFRLLNELENDLLSDNCDWETLKYISDTRIGIYSTKEVKDSNAEIPSNLIFKYDKIINSVSQQSQIYENVGKRIVGDVMEDTTEQYLPMDNLGQVKHIQCMALIFMMVFIKELY